MHEGPRKRPFSFLQNLLCVLRMRAGRVAEHSHAFADITGHHAACTDQRVIANAYAGQDQGTSTYPDVLANGHRAAELKPAASY